MTTIVHSDRDSSKVGNHAAHATSHSERELRHKLDKAKRDYEARLLLVEALLTSADLGINRRRSRALERAMGELVQVNARHIRALAALGDFLIDGTHS
ncbi:MAG TPA: hypothetical protein VN893_23525 [Bryobacteraceae bacterium]|nr:hypothetical protein [Bryobacteraceae bacterium]